MGFQSSCSALSAFSKMVLFRNTFSGASVARSKSLSDGDGVGVVLAGDGIDGPADAGDRDGGGPVLTDEHADSGLAIVTPVVGVRSKRCDHVGFFFRKLALNEDTCFAVFVPTAWASRMLDLSPTFMAASLNRSSSCSDHLALFDRVPRAAVCWDRRADTSA